MQKLSQKLFSKSKGVFILKIFNAGFAFLTSILLARLLGPSDFGLYNYTFTIIFLISIPVTLGIDKLSIREIAIYQSESNWGLIRGFLSWSNKIVLLISITVALIGIGLAWILLKDTNSPELLVYILAMISLPIFCLRRLRLSAMQGFQQIMKAMLPENLMAPVLMILLVGLGYLLLGSDLNISWIMLIRLVVITISCVIGYLWVYQSLPNEVKIAIPEYQRKIWLKNALSFMFFGIFGILHLRIDIVLLGSIKGVQEVGLYTAAFRAISVLNFIPTSILTTIRPKIAQLYAEGKMQVLQKMITLNTRKTFFWSVIPILVLMGLSYQYLLLFGIQFTSAQNTLIILCLTQLVNKLSGFSIDILNMTKYQNDSMLIKVASLILNVILNLFFIPSWGINGAAIATAISVTLGGIVGAIVVYQRLKINTTVF